MFTVDELKLIDSYIPLNGDTGSVKQKIIETLEEAESYDLCLWSFYWDCGRAGELEGVFKATKEDVAEVVGREVYFGEVLGKHSEVFGTIEEGEITLISEDPVKVMNADESGFNPLDYVEED